MVSHMAFIAVYLGMCAGCSAQDAQHGVIELAAGVEVVGALEEEDFKNMKLIFQKITESLVLMVSFWIKLLIHD